MICYNVWPLHQHTNMKICFENSLTIDIEMCCIAYVFCHWWLWLLSKLCNLICDSAFTLFLFPAIHTLLPFVFSFVPWSFFIISPSILSSATIAWLSFVLYHKLIISLQLLFTTSILFLSALLPLALSPCGSYYMWGPRYGPFTPALSSRNPGARC